MQQRHLHLDCFSGLAGDMFLAACVDLGVERELLMEVPGRLGLREVTVEFHEDRRGGMRGLRCRVLSGGRVVDGDDPAEANHPPGTGHGHHTHEGHGRGLEEILRRIRDSGLEAAVRERAEAMFVRLGEVEAAVHGVELSAVHFHEVGAVDSMVDIVGAAVAMDDLAPDVVTHGRLVVGSGGVDTAHGWLPVPAPATAALLVGRPVALEGEGELMTPTGALILDGLGAQPVGGRELVADAFGWGLGRRSLADRPNAVRLTMGRSIHDAATPGEEVTVLETQVDDATGELLGEVIPRLLEAGALDVFLVPVWMKKGRPGHLITVLAPPELASRLAVSLLRETGSLGCRVRTSRRLVADRQSGRIETAFGSVDFKLSRLEGEILTLAPEADSCRAVARAAGIPWREVYAHARDALRALGAEPSDQEEE